MFPISPIHPLFICHQPVNFRLGIDGLAGYCRNILTKEPMEGAIFVFRNKQATSIRLLFYVEDGWWLCTKRFSEGKIKIWPEPEGGNAAQTQLSALAARELSVLLWKGNPQGAKFPPFWKKIPAKT